MIRRPSPYLSFVFLFSALLSSCGDSGPGSANSPASVALVPVTGSLSLLAGGLGGSGNRDANGNDARFNQPMGLAVAADGTRYVADSVNHTVRKISPSGDVTTLAGEPGVSGSSDGVGSAAHFKLPGGLAVASDGTVYVADTANFTLRQIAPDGTVSTLAGQAGSHGFADASGALARFETVYQVVLAADGNLYVADAGNHAIRRVTTAGVVSTLAGLPGTSGMVDGNGLSARFNFPAGIGLAGSNALYIADSGNDRIRQVTLAGDVTTVAGGSNSGWIDGNAASARFNYPFSVAVAADGTAYVGDLLNQVVRRISTSGQVTTLAGQVDTAGSDDGTGSAARFSYPAGIAADPAGGLWVADVYNHALRHVSDAGDVTTPVALTTKAAAVDATGALARFSSPGAVAAGPDGAIYVADTGNHVIRKVDAAGVATTFAGLAGTSGTANGSGSTARFNAPLGVAVDADGTVYVADTGSHTIRKITPAGVVSTLAGLAGTADSVNGSGTAARFSSPGGIAIDGAGNLYVADTGNNQVRKITPAGVVTTLAGWAGSSGTADGVGDSARFNAPLGIAVDVAGTVYVTDSASHTLRKITAAGVVSTLAGAPGLAGSADGSGSSARFSSPAGIAVDTDLNIYVSDSGNHTLRMVTPAGAVSTLAGQAGIAGVLTGTLPGGLNQPSGMTIGMDGALYVSSENSVLKATLPTPVPVFHVFLQAAASTVSLGQDINLRWVARDATNCVASGPDWSGAKAAAGSAALTPVATGTVSYTLTCDENGGTGTGSATATVTVVDPPPAVSLAASASAIGEGGSVTLTWSSSGATGCTASGDWAGSRGTSGSEVLSPALGARSYTLACTGPGGTQSGTVNVSVLGPPTVSLGATPSTLTLGQSLLLTWTSASATSCSATGSWAGFREVNGSTSLTPGGTGTYTYGITCTGPAGSASDTVSVEVKPAPVAAPAATGGGGGALGLEGLAPLALLAALRRRRPRAD